MTSVKCPKCSLTNWATAGECKRCGFSFQTRETQAPPPPHASGGRAFDNAGQTAHQSPNFHTPSEWSANPFQNQTYQTPNYQYNQPANLKSGLAIASMILGILGFITSIFLVGIIIAPIGLILGIIALIKANKKPHIYDGKGFAVAGIVTSAMVVLFIPIIAAIAIPNLLAARRAANEGSAIASLRTLSGAEQTYIATAGAGSCGDLKTLGSSKLIDPVLAKGEKSGYRFTIVDLPTRTGDCDIHATPLTDSTGTRSFYISTQDGILRGADKKGKMAGRSDLPLDRDAPIYQNQPSGY